MPTLQKRWLDTKKKTISMPKTRIQNLDATKKISIPKKRSKNLDAKKKTSRYQLKESPFFFCPPSSPFKIFVFAVFLHFKEKRQP